MNCHECIAVGTAKHLEKLDLGEGDFITRRVCCISHLGIAPCLEAGKKMVPEEVCPEKNVPERMVLDKCS